MPLWPITRAEVEQHLGLTPAAAGVDTAHLDLVTEAVVEQVEAWTAEPRGASIRLGAIMLAARLYARRGSPLGVAAFGDLGATYVKTHDSDIESLLGLGKPMVG